MSAPPQCDSCEKRDAQIERWTPHGWFRLCGVCSLRVKEPVGWRVVNARSERTTTL